MFAVHTVKVDQGIGMEAYLNSSICQMRSFIKIMEIQAHTRKVRHEHKPGSAAANVQGDRWGFHRLVDGV